MKASRVVLLLIAIILVVGAFISVFLFSGGGPGCSRPVGGFLVIADSRGFNDSVDLLNFTSSAPPHPWPVIVVSKGSTVTIMVCNRDKVAHGFQIAHYYSNNIASIAPGKELTVTFTADVPGSFQVYCEVPCPIHVYMQYGSLVVK